MDRINTATKAVDLYGAGKNGFKNSNASLGTSATDFNAEWPNGVQEELLGLIEGAGIVAALATLNQVRQGVKRLAGANVRTITAAGPTALTADDAGLIVVDATANAVTITLPAANLVTGVPLAFEFVRADASANAVTINRAGADTFIGGATSMALVGRRDQRVIRSDATSKWVVTSSGGVQLINANGYREIGGGLILQWGSQAVTSTQASYNFPLAFPNAGLNIVLADGDASAATITFAAHIVSASQFSAICSGASVLGSYFAIGY